jgi:uncharacterized membrane protein
MMHPALLSPVAEGHSPIVGFLGRLHPGVIHFPIALLSIAALFEMVWWVRKKSGLAPGTLALVWLAAPSAVAASVFGWLLADYEGTEGSLVELHRWVGLAGTAVGVVAAGLAWKGRTSPGALLACRGALVLGSGLVLAAGYLGGDLVFGANHLFSVFKEKQPRPAAPSGPAAPETSLPQTPGKKVDFPQEIAPILKENCIKCHCLAKKKGKLLLDTRENAMKGGGNGKCIIPGKPEKSTLYTLLVETDPDVRMPEKADPLPPGKIALIKAWIEQGSPWPEGVVIK